MEQYNFNRAKYGTHSLIAEEIGKNKAVLDAGCNKGYLKQLASNNLFYGIDNDMDDLEMAKIKHGYAETFKIDLNNYEIFKTDRKFNIIILADILEHLLYPEKVLGYFAKNYLEKNGKIIISLPNVANFSVRLELLLGNFNYRESGILDKTHLHLYTLKSARELLERCGLKIKKEKFSSNNFGGIIKKLPFLGGILGYNLIFICERKS
jgi:2-polyprenyl-3-methyl-5-hydroxy-6-metoxy-1,4-benzoquinol methylase